MNKIFNFLFFTAFYFGSIFASDIEFEADKTSFDTKNELLLLEGNVSLKIENTGASQSWRLGTFRLDIQPDGRR